MDFFDKVKKKATETYKVTAEKTGKIAKETKLKLKISDLKSSVQDMYEVIGKKVYEKHELGKKSISFADDLSEEIKKIENLTSEIAKLNLECLDLQDKMRCPKCDSEIKKDSKFCPNCGEKIIEKKKKTPSKKAQTAPKGKGKSTVKKESTNIKSANVKATNNKPATKKEPAKKPSNAKENKKAEKNLEKTVEVESNVKK